MFRVLKNIFSKISTTPVQQTHSSAKPGTSPEISDPSLVTADLLREIRGMSFLARKQASEGMVGLYRTAFKGKGIEFEDLRSYAPGDDIRTIHWAATARSQFPQVKRYREERELSIMLAVDVSASHRGGTGTEPRRKLVAQLGATLASIALNNNDKIGLVTFSDRIETYIPPRKKRGTVWKVIHEILLPQANHRPGTDLGQLCTFLTSVLKRRTVVLIVSDMIDDGYDHALAILARRHDVSIFIIRDSAETTIPPIGILRCLDPETGRRGAPRYGKRIPSGRILHEK